MIHKATVHMRTYSLVLFNTINTLTLLLQFQNLSCSESINLSTHNKEELYGWLWTPWRHLLEEIAWKCSIAWKCWIRPWSYPAGLSVSLFLLLAFSPRSIFTTTVINDKDEETEWHNLCITQRFRFRLFESENLIPIQEKHTGHQRDTLCSFPYIIQNYSYGHDQLIMGIVTLKNSQGVLSWFGF